MLQCANSKDALQSWCVVQVQEWEAKDASTHPTAVIDSSTAKRRKVYFGCRDVYNDPQVCQPSCKASVSF